jgi:hypothetical protein
MIVPIDKLADRAISDITCIVIHHSVAQPTLDIEEISAEEIASQGFICVGYNGYVKKTGEDSWLLQEGRPIDKLPAAQYGMNTEGYAICLGGNFEPGAAPFLTVVTQNALDTIIDHIKQVKLKAPNLKYLIGHEDVATIKQHQGLNPGDYSTACPGKNLYAKLDAIRLATGLLRYPGI